MAAARPAMPAPIIAMRSFWGSVILMDGREWWLIVGVMVSVDLGEAC